MLGVQWQKEGWMQALRLPELTPDAIRELDELYHKTRDVRLRTRAQMILLAAERHLVASEIAQVVRTDEQTVRNWLKRYLAEGANGLADAPRPGSPGKVDAAYDEQLLRVVRQRPRSLGQPYSLWTLQRLADYMAEQTGTRVEAETVRLHLKAGGIVLSRPQHKISSPDPEYELKKRRSKRPEMASSPMQSSTTLMRSTSVGCRPSEPSGALRADR
jgi:transposase